MSNRSGHLVDQTMITKAQLERCMIAKIIKQSAHADQALNASGNRWRKFSKRAEETTSNLRRFLPLEQDLFLFYTNNSLEFTKSCDDLNWKHDKATPLGAETNGIAERAVRWVKEGTSALLVQAGLHQKFVEEKRWNVIEIRGTFKICLVQYSKTLGLPCDFLKRHKQADTTYLVRKFSLDFWWSISYFVGGSWIGDLLTVDAEDTKTIPASDIHVARFKTEEIEVPTIISQHVFPCANGSLRQEDLPDHSHPPAASSAEVKFVANEWPRKCWWPIRISPGWPRCAKEANIDF